MKRFLLVLVALVLLLFVWLHPAARSSPKPVKSATTDVVVAVAGLTGTGLIQSGAPAPAAAASNVNFTDETAHEPPDVLSATNLDQWKFLIKDLKPVPMLKNYLMTSRFRAGAPPVVLKHDDRSIIYKAEAVEVMTVPRTADFMEAQIYSPKMSIDETRELGLKLCGMFGFDSGKFLAWCNAAADNWMDTQSFSTGDHSHAMSVRGSFNEKKPWFIIFTIQDQSARMRLMQTPSP